ncbi:hypothetical protein QJS10_CPA03g00224 [Acorus calamus]|uniref:B30.2/SPRY domain-containing protein n=1 Tax=Acorus calamus TaxID=4465 RepID=A0AAV9F6S7_ACOCL|nr:hypothetical protein QJS10_CPA03g00224 [Acorus calamus]
MVTNQEPGSDFSFDLVKLGLRLSEDDIADVEAEEVPSHLNTNNSSGGFVVVSTDKLSVKYTSCNLHGHDVGSVQANCPAPSRRLVYYFEIEVVNAGQKGQIAIGFTTENFKMKRQPGWEPNSYGYHGDDGLIYRGSGRGESFGPTFTTGDTVGGGINYATQELFFTKNRELLGTIYKDVKGPLFPTISVHSPNEEDDCLSLQICSLKVHLHDCPFLFALLWYQDTLESFDAASNNTPIPNPMIQENGLNEQGVTFELHNRKILRQLIRSGDIDSTFSRLWEWYPQIVQAGHIEDAFNYARSELAKFFEIPRLEDLLQVFNDNSAIQKFHKIYQNDTIALLAYEEPTKSPVGHLLKMNHREVVADAVNAMVLSTDPNVKDAKSCLQSHLEKLLRQLTACCLERRALNGDQGEAFHFHSVVNSGKEVKPASS